MRESQGHLRRLRGAGLGLCVAGAAAAAVALLSAPQAAAAGSLAIAADRQNYAPQPNGAPDAWSANNAAFGGSSSTQDQVDMHVGATPQAVTYISYVHLEVDALPHTSTVTSLLLTVHPTDDQLRQDENVNSGTAVCPNGNTSNCQTQQNLAVLDAFPLKSAYPASFNSSTPPDYDAQGPEAVGKFNDKDASWSFELAPLITYWQQHGNTGLALVPDAAATQGPWSIGFYMAATTAKAETAGAASGNGLSSSSSAVSLTFSGGGGLPAVSLPPNIAQGLPAPQPVHPATGGQVAQSAHGGTGTPAASAAPPSGMVPIWLLVLAVCTTGAAALLAQPVSQALGAAAGVGPALVSQLRLHPRMFGVAAVLLVWSSTFSVYANTLGRPLLSSSGLASNQGGGGSGSGSSSSNGTNPAGGSTASTNAGTSGASGSAGPGAAGAAAASQQYANSPNPPSANLFQPNQETVGLTASQIFLCAHAALTFGPAFNIGASDLNVFWQMVNDQGGVWGRKVVYYDSNGNLQSGINITDDGYQPSKAVVAAQQCQDEQGGDFFLLSGIGFDQIPAVRVWAEQHHVLYVHHIALQAGSDGLRYSFTMLPALENVGTQYGQYYVSHMAGKKIGIIERNSSNWEAGSATFKQALQAAGYGSDIVADDQVQNNQGQYAQEISDMQVKGAQVVLIWENALAAEQIVNQANQQGYDPTWLEFPFDLTLQTLATAGVPPSELTKMYGMVPWPAYTCYAEGIPQYGSYVQELRQFEAAYAKYDPGAKLCSVGGDLLFGTWEAWRQVYDLLYQCGRFCTRDKVAGLMLSGYHATVGANCPVDFRGADGHHGGYDEDLYHVIANVSTSGPAGTYSGPAWVNDQPFCQRNIS